MDLTNMNFRDFIKPRSQKPAPMPAEPELDEEFEEQYQEPVRKVVKRVPVEEYEEPDEDSEYDEDEEYYEEPPRRIVQRPAPRPVPQPVRRPQPQVVKRQVRPARQPGYAMADDQFRRPLVVKPKQLQETTIEGTATSLTEAIKRKVDTVFYRFGIQGLEKLDEKILDTIEELQYPEPKQVRKPLKEMRRAPARKPVKKYRPLPLENVRPVPQPVYEEPPVEYEEPVYEEPVEELDEQVVIEEEAPIIEEAVQTPPPPPAPKVSSPKPAFLQPAKKVEQPVIESTGDEDEDLITAAMSMDFADEKEEQEPAVSDEDIWGTVEAILETEPQQKLVHEPQTQSMIQPIPVEEATEETVEEPKEEPKPKTRKRKAKTTKTEETTTNEEK